MANTIKVNIIEVAINYVFIWKLGIIIVCII